jgi:hypothetical protein
MTKNYLLAFLCLFFFSTGLIAQTTNEISGQPNALHAEHHGESITHFDGQQPAATESASRGMTVKDIPMTGLLLIPESSNGYERVMAFDPHNGNLIDEFFIPIDYQNMTTPIQVIWNHDETSLLVSDQIKKTVLQYSPEGAFQQTFAPSGGVDDDIMSNIRGIYMKPDGTLLVAVAGGANAHSVAMFNTQGEYIGNFIDNNAGGIQSPFSIIYRPDFDDYLITANGSDGIHRYNAQGEFIEMFASLPFPQQIHLLSNGNVLVANFGQPYSGLYEYNSAGEQIGYYDVAWALRGVHELGNGNLLVTNGGGVHEINRNNQLIETKMTGNMRHISFIKPPGVDFYNLSLAVSPQGAGTVSGAGYFPEGHTVNLTATAGIFHQFHNWTDPDGAVVSETANFQYQIPDQDITLTANFTELDTYNVLFSVVEQSVEEDPIEDARINIKHIGLITTDEHGQASIELPVGSFEATVKRHGYIDQEVSIVVADQDINIVVHMEDVIFEPLNLEIHLEGLDEDEALLTWVDPADVHEFRYDDGVPVTSLGFPQGTWNSVMGSVHHNNAVIRELSWFMADNPDDLKIWVLALDANGAPDRTRILYSADDVPSGSNQWNHYEFSSPIEAPNGFFIGLSYNGFLALAVDDGVGEPWEFVPGMQYGVFNITDPGVPFNLIENWNYEQNYLIRAHGVNLGEVSFNGSQTAEDSGPAPVTRSIDPSALKAAATSEKASTRAMVGFNVFLNDMETPVAAGITETEFLFTDLEWDLHKAGVQTVYTTGVSDIVMLYFEAGVVPAFEVNFEVDLTRAINHGLLEGFDPETHTIKITGDMVEWAEPGTNPEAQVMEKVSDDPLVYRKTFHLSAGTYEYKFFSDLIGDGWDGGEWPGGDNRVVQVTGDMTVSDLFGPVDLQVINLDHINLNVFPNPASNRLTLESNVLIHYVRMVDMLGQVIFTLPVDDFRADINVSDQKSAVYFLQVLTSEGMVTRLVQVSR